MSNGDVVKGCLAEVNLTKRYIVEIGPGTDTTLPEADLPTAEGERVHGVVVDDDALATNHVAIQIAGECEVIAGEAIAIGGAITTGATGKAMAAAADDYVLGFALEEATADGDFILMFINHQGITTAPA